MKKELHYNLFLVFILLMSGNSYLFTLILFLGLSNFSCRIDFQLDPNEQDEQLVIFGKWSNNLLEVSLSRTSSSYLILSPDSLRINDGELYLIDSTSRTQFRLQHLSNGIYTLDIVPLVGHQYMIKAKWKNSIAFSTLEIMPAIPTNLMIKRSMTVRDPDSKFVLSTKYNLSFIAPLEPAYIQASLSKNKIHFGGSISPLNYKCRDASPLILNTICAAGKEVSWDFEFNNFKGYYINYNTPDSGKSFLLSYGPDTGYFHLNINIVSLTYFKYLASIQENEPAEKLFLPPNSVYTNIYNGLGIFYIQNQVKDSIRISP